MTREEFDGWKASHTTQEVFAYLKRRREEWVGALCSLCLGASKVDDMVQASKYAATVETIDLMCELEFDDLKEEIRHEET